MKYVALRDALLEDIARLETHGQLPSERELVRRFGVSRMTVRHAIDALIADGHVYRVHGAGTFVADRMIAKGLELTGFSEDMRARGMNPSSLVLTLREQPAGAQVGQDLEISPRDPVVQVRRVRLADGQPMCLETVHLPSRLFPGLVHERLDGSLYQVMERSFQLQVTTAAQTIRPTVLTEDEATLLAAPVLSPALLVRRIGRDVRGRTLERAESLYRGDRYVMSVRVRRRVDGSAPGQIRRRR